MAVASRAALLTRIPFFRRGYLSLRWRLLIPLTLSLAAGIAVMAWLNHASLNRQADRQRGDALRRDAALLTFLVAQERQRLTDAGASLAEVLAANNWTPDHDPAESAGHEHSAVSPIDWSRLSLDFVSLGLYDTHGRTVEGFGEFPPKLADLPLAVQRTERPVSGVVCDTTCHFYAALPILRRGTTVGSMTLTGDLSHLLAGFSLGARRDLAVVTADADGTTVRMANGDAMRSSSLPVFEGNGTALRIVSAAGRTYEWQRLPLARDAGVYLLTRLDISAAVAEQERALYRSAVTSLALFATGEIALLLALGWLGRRMARVGAGLPLLGQGLWHEARKRLADGERSPRDEFGELERAALALASQLGTLDDENRRQKHELEHLIDTLSGERDFMNRLLETAPAPILTQTLSGTLRRVNRQVETLLGRSRQQLIGRSYYDCLVASAERESCRRRLHDLASQPNATLRVETPLQSLDGSVHNIAWVHTLLRGDVGGEALVLSVGLDLTELKQARAEANYLTDHDALTGLLNRTAFQRNLQQQLRDAPNGALLTLDLDNFKSLNDLIGPAAGDEMIRRMADHLRSLEPAPLLLGRTGGDDFAAWFGPMAEVELLQIARHLCLGDTDRNIATTCVGLAIATGGSAVELMAQADLALSQAQARGRSSWHLFNADDGMREGLAARNESHEQITAALHEDRLRLMLQPIVALKTGVVSHYEVLLRVELPDGRLLAPTPLIAAAEESGLIRDIDDWVLNASIALMGRSANTLRLAVNLSARSLDAGLHARLAEMLLRHDVSARQLMLEITETAALSQIEEAGVLLTDIRSLGCKLALDDFGVGFSTFQYLKHLPVDYVKIDGSFIRSVHQNQDDQVFVRALTEAAHGFGKQVIAEFVENDAILATIRKLGVDYAQGYLFDRPRSPAEILDAAPAAAF